MFGNLCTNPSNNSKDSTAPSRQEPRARVGGGEERAEFRAVESEGPVGHPRGLRGRRLGEWIWAQTTGVEALGDCSYCPGRALEERQ